MRNDLKHVQDTGCPLFITAHGRTAGVLLSPDANDQLAEKAALLDDLDALRKSLEDVRAGRTSDAHQALRDIAASLGFELEP